VPFAVSGNRVATIDPASFGSSAAVLTDFTRAVFGIVGDLPDVQPTTGGLAAGFAPEKAAEKAPQSNVASRAQEALAGLDAYASDRLIFKNPSMVTGDGRAVWARGFGGQRIQQADAQAQTFRTATTFFGGAMGADLLVRPDLRLGALAGGGSTRSSQAANSGDGESDIGFGGLYGRTRFGASFIDAMVLFGGSRNRTTRTINNNLAPGGVETARADFNGWFVAPELALGRRIAFGSGWAVIPALRLRYLAAGFGGSTETGTSAPLTVNARTLQSIEERGELKLTKAESIRSGTVLLSAHAGVLGLQRIGDSDVNATLLGQSLAFATPGKSSITGVYTGLGADWPISGRLSAFGGIEYTVMTDLSETVSGRGGVRMTW
jgi:outer membrane autotransporter protein